MGTRSRLPSTSTRAALAPFRAGVHSKGGTASVLTTGDAAIVYPLASTSAAVANTNTAITNVMAIVITAVVVLASSVVSVATTTAVIALAMAVAIRTADIVANTTVTTIT